MADGRTFRLNATIPGIPGGATVELTPATDADVFQAVATNAPFPDRPLSLAHLSVTSGSDRDLVFGDGGASVRFSASGAATMALAVCDGWPEAVQSLGLGGTAELDLAQSDGDQPSRYSVFTWKYSLDGSARGTHPLGVVGSASFGVVGKREAQYAVVHRFPAQTGARDVLEATFDSWRLPRHVAAAEDLAPGSLLVAEVNGSIAVEVAAQLGYDFSFLRQVKAGGLQGDVGLKLDARLKAVLGFEASGRYLVGVGRDSLDVRSTRVRVRVFKLSKKGWTFGLDVNATAALRTDVLPESADGLMSAVFGVHGLQVVRELQALERWVNRDDDPSRLVVGLTREVALDLLRRTTGLGDADGEFDRARGVLTDVVRAWNGLPARFASALWSLLERAGVHREIAGQVRSVLTALAGDEAARKAAIREALSSVSFASSPAGRLLVAGAERGLAALLDRSDRIQGIAATALGILDGGVIERLQAFVAGRLRLEPLLAAGEGDFGALDEWLVGRIGGFLDERFEAPRLREVQHAIRAVLARRDEIYGRVREALNRSYEAELASRYQHATTKTALIDVEFDTSRAPARDRLVDVLAGASYDAVLLEDTDGVVLHRGVLTHEISRAASVRITLPFYDTRTDSLTTSLARVRAEAETGHVLFYEIDASDTVARRHRMTSQLSVSGSIIGGSQAGVRRFAEDELTWSYRYLHAEENMRREELEALAAPLVERYLPGHFGGEGSSFSTWLTDFDRRVEEEVGTPTNDFGDVLLSLEVSAPEAALAAWFEPRDAEQLKQAAMTMSLRLQDALRRLLPFCYFQDVRRLGQDALAAPLLVFGAMPPSTSVRLDRGRLTLDTRQRVYWDWRSARIREAMARHPSTQARLRAALARAHARLVAVGHVRTASFFAEGDVEEFLALVGRGAGEQRLSSLLMVEAEIVEGAERALRDAARFGEQSGGRPGKAIERLAAFGEHITRTFNSGLDAYFGGAGLRPLGTMVFLEASSALAGESRFEPTAVLRILVLREGSTFALPSFLDNEMPDRTDIAVGQTLVGT